MAATSCNSPNRLIPSLWQRLHITEEPPPAWLAQHAPKDGRIGYDPLLISEEGLARYTDAGLTDGAGRTPIRSMRSGPIGRRRQLRPPSRIRWHMRAGRRKTSGPT